MAQEFKEKAITINLSGEFNKPETARAKKAATILKDAVKKETRKKEIWTSNAVNEKLWSRGLKKSLRKITVKVISDKDRAKVYLPEEKVEEKKKEVKDKAKVEAPKQKEEPKAEAEKKEPVKEEKK